MQSCVLQMQPGYGHPAEGQEVPHGINGAGRDGNTYDALMQVRVAVMQGITVLWSLWGVQIWAAGWASCGVGAAVDHSGAVGNGDKNPCGEECCKSQDLS